MFKTFLILALLLAGCPSEKPKVEPIEQPPPEKPQPIAAPTSLEALHPVIAPVPESSTAPEKIVVHFAYPIVAGENAAIDERTKLVIEPAVSGTLRFSSASTLEFLPTAPFAPDTEYTILLESVQIGEQTVRGKVERKLRTPAFAFARADLASVDAAKKRIAVDLVFTGPVLLDDVAAQANLRIETPVKPRFERTAKNNVVRATVSDAALRGSIELTLGEGVRSLDRSARAPAAEATIRIPAGAPIKIHAAHPREGASGFYVQVVCTDEASGKNTMYFW